MSKLSLLLITTITIFATACSHHTNRKVASDDGSGRRNLGKDTEESETNVVCYCGPKKIYDDYIVVWGSDQGAYLRLDATAQSQKTGHPVDLESITKILNTPNKPYGFLCMQGMLEPEALKAGNHILRNFMGLYQAGSNCKVTIPELDF